MQTFADTYLVEMLMREDDFPYTSQYFYISPDDNALNSGPRWDYDKEFWRVAPKDSWNLYNLNYYNRAPIDLWVHLGQHKPFIDLVNSIREATVETNLAIINEHIRIRQSEIDQGYFDRNIERWDIFGKQPYSYIQNILYAVYGLKAGAKSTMAKELDRVKQYFEKRSQWMKSTPLTGFSITEFQFWPVVIAFLTPLILSILALLAAAVYAIYKKLNPSQEKAANAEELEFFVVKNNNKIIF